MLCIIAMLSCTNKEKTAGQDDSDSLAADSVEALAQDTVPKPMFLYALGPDNMQMVYWTDLKEPKRTKDNADYFDESHQAWELQEGFRQHAAQYTKMLIDDKFVNIKYTGELVKNPDGEIMYGGELHGRPGIPSPGLRYAFADAKDKKRDVQGMYIAATASYLESHKLIEMKDIGGNTPLPNKVIRQLENEYKMKAGHSLLVCKNQRYSYGVMQFKGVYKTVTEYGQKHKEALALEVITDGDKVYSYPVEGYYDDQYGPTWNVDDEGRYIQSDIVAFEGPLGFEFFFKHWAPESLTVGRMYADGDKLARQEYEGYHVLIDESVPLWKKDIARMQQLYFEADPSQNKNYKFTKYCYLYLSDDYDHPEVWMRDKDDQHGAFFIRRNGDIQLIATENERLHPSFPQSRDGVGYLKISGSSGGPSIYMQVFEISKSRIVHRFTGLEIYGEMDRCTRDGKPISGEEGKHYIETLPPVENNPIYWQEINN